MTTKFRIRGKMLEREFSRHSDYADFIARINADPRWSGYQVVVPFRDSTPIGVESPEADWPECSGEIHEEPAF